MDICHTRRAAYALKAFESPANPHFEEPQVMPQRNSSRGTIPHLAGLGKERTR